MNGLIPLENHEEEMLPSKAPNGFGYVYAVEATFGMVKIGATNNPSARIRGIKRAAGISPSQIYVTDLHSNYFQNEASAHKEFAMLRRTGEWFNVGFDDVTDYLDSLPMDMDAADIAKAKAASGAPDKYISSLDAMLFTLPNGIRYLGDLDWAVVDVEINVFSSREIRRTKVEIIAGCIISGYDRDGIRRNLQDFFRDVKRSRRHILSHGFGYAKARSMLAESFVEMAQRSDTSVTQEK